MSLKPYLRWELLLAASLVGCTTPLPGRVIAPSASSVSTLSAAQTVAPKVLPLTVSDPVASPVAVSPGTHLTVLSFHIKWPARSVRSTQVIPDQTETLDFTIQPKGSGEPIIKQLERPEPGAPLDATLVLSLDPAMGPIDIMVVAHDANGKRLAEGMAAGVALRDNTLVSVGVPLAELFTTLAGVEFNADFADLWAPLPEGLALDQAVPEATSSGQLLPAARWADSDLVLHPESVVTYTSMTPGVTVDELGMVQVASDVATNSAAIHVRMVVPGAATASAEATFHFAIKRQFIATLQALAADARTFDTLWVPSATDSANDPTTDVNGLALVTTGRLSVHPQWNDVGAVARPELSYVWSSLTPGVRVDQDGNVSVEPGTLSGTASIQVTASATHGLPEWAPVTTRILFPIRRKTEAVITIE